MGSRWLQEKRTKQRRMRRAYLKSYSMKRPPSDPNSFGFVNLTTDKEGRPVQEFISLTISARSRAAQQGYGSRAEYLNALFKGKVVHRETQSLTTAIRDAPYSVSVLCQTKYEELRLVMGGEENFFIRVLERGSTLMIWRSLVYATRKLAMIDHSYNVIKWVEPPEVVSLRE